MNRYFLEVAYWGTSFHGSQIQNELPTVQGALNKALSILFKRPIETFGASRTDEGVHAYGNMYHVDLEEELWPSFQYQMNAILPESMSLNKVYQAKDLMVNARFDALERSYEYRIYQEKNPFLKEAAFYFPFKLDKELLNQTAKIIKEYTDFESFSKKNSQTLTHNCHIYQSEWKEERGILSYHVTGSRFLRGMVRALVGTQLRIGRGKGGMEEFREIIESKNCQLADFSVPGHGLFLSKIVYPEGYLKEIFFKKGVSDRDQGIS